MIAEVRAFFAAWRMVDEKKNRGCVEVLEGRENRARELLKAC
jgi:hypothetical protein